MGDLHGRFDLLENSLSAIADHATLPATLVMRGDYVDHGPASRQIIQRLRGGLGHLHSTLVCLKGNHEDIMYRTCCKPIPPGWWLLNGGGDTLLSYGHTPQGAIDCSCIPDDDLDWIKSLPLLHVDKHRVYVHAWLDRDLDLNKQKTIKDIDGNLAMLWKIYADDDDGGHRSRHVVHGHHKAFGEFEASGNSAPASRHHFVVRSESWIGCAGRALFSFLRAFKSVCNVFV